MTKKIGTKLPETLILELQNFAASTGRKICHIVEAALKQYLEQEWPKQNFPH